MISLTSSPGFYLVGPNRPVYIRPMQTALHIAALVNQLKVEIAGGRIVSTGFYKKVRTALIIVKKDSHRAALAFVYHPAGSGCFCVPASKIKLETTEKPWPIFGLDGADIIEIVHPALDRIFELVVRHQGEVRRVVFEALGPNGNLWLLDRSGGRQATLRNRKYVVGERYEPPEIGDRLNPYQITGEQLIEWLGPKIDRSPLAALKGGLLGFDDTMTREALSRAGLPVSELGSLDDQQANALAGAVRDIAQRFTESHSAYLYIVQGGAEVYPFKLVSVEAQPDRFKTLSLATMEMVARRQVTVVETDEEKRLLRAVAAAIKRQQRLIKNVESDLEKAAGFERYKRLGELLQLNRDRMKKGMTSIEVEDVFSEPHPKVVIELDPALSPNENVDDYFRRHRKGRESLDLLKRRLEIVTGELDSLDRMRDELEADFETARNRYQAELTSLLPREADKREIQPRLPYREARLSTGLTVFIGRAGADNDRTTFEFAKPYELWFHAQQCAGSHVVMKFPNKSFQPSKREIEETAAIAAWHSKARHDSLVPVAYAERRHVRKPRKAKPGLVTVEREKSVMVVPQKERSSGD